MGRALRVVLHGAARDQAHAADASHDSHARVADPLHDCGPEHVCPRLWCAALACARAGPATAWLTPLPGLLSWRANRASNPPGRGRRGAAHAARGAAHALAGHRRAGRRLRGLSQRMNESVSYNYMYRCSGALRARLSAHGCSRAAAAQEGVRVAAREGSRPRGPARRGQRQVPSDAVGTARSHQGDGARRRRVRSEATQRRRQTCGVCVCVCF